MLSSAFATAALFLSVANKALASPCIAMDSSMNLYAFGLGGKDYNAGTQDSWTGTTAAKDITSIPGRPPFDGANTTCYLAQFFNAIYVMNGDASDTSAVHIFDAAKQSWTKQEVTAGKFDPTDFSAILDHDTNVFYALSKGELFFLDFGSLVAANSTALAWTDVEAAQIKTDGYQPVMAIAQNHIHFLDVPGNSAGQASIYVIHFNYFQPEVQSYPAASGQTFPQQHGKVSSFFQPSDGGQVQQEFAFIPDDGSNTFVINVENNSTTPLGAPPVVDAGATYFAGVTSLVQLTSSGQVNFLPYKQGQAATNTAAKWSAVGPLAAAAPSSSAAGSATGTGTSSGTTKATGTGKTGGSATGGSGSPSGTASGSNPSSTSGAIANTISLGLSGALTFMVASLLA